MPYTYKFVLSFALLLFIGHQLVPSAVAQDRNVTFIHGLFGNSNSLSRIEADVQDEFAIDSRRLGYSSDNSIPSIASGEHPFVQSNSVVVAHSMGGLVSRSMVRQFGTSRVDALITTGTPHNGVRAASAVQNGVAAALLNHWVGDLSLGFAAIGGYSPVDGVARTILDHLFEWVDFHLEQSFNVQSVDDMVVGSPFLTDINNNFGASTPGATYAIGGLEDWNSQHRLAAATLRSDDMEGNIMAYVNGARYSYLATSVTLQSIAGYKLYKYNQTGEWRYYDQYIYYSSVAQAFFVGFDSLNRQQQLEWALNITGAWNGPGTPLRYSDGLVPITSQIPVRLRGGQELRAYSANHIELTARENALDRVKDAFIKSDVNVPPANQPPLSAFTYSISGNTVNFTNQSSDPDGSIASYAWDFGDGGTSTYANTSHSYSSGSYTVTLTVVDNDGRTDSSSRSFYIPPGSGSCLSPPCPILEPIESF